MDVPSIGTYIGNGDVNRGMSEPGIEPGVAAERKLQALDSAPIGITISDATKPDNPLVYVNEAFEHITGYDSTAILGKNCRILQGPETEPEAVQTLREHIDAESDVSVELLNYRSDGKPFWNEVTVAPLFQDGTLTHFVGFQVDVTARKEAEIDARNYRHELEALIDRLHGLIQDVTELLMQSVSRPETEHEICERIVAADPYTLAAFAELDMQRDEVFITSMSGSPSNPDELVIPVTQNTPIARSIEEKTVVITSPGAIHEAFAEVCGALAIAPLSYGTRNYGILIVGTDETAVFEGQERAVIEALGSAISIAINAAESRQLLVADNVAELEFELSPSDWSIAAIATDRGITFEYEGSIKMTDERTAMCFTTDADPNDLRRELQRHNPSAKISVISDDEDQWLIALEANGGRFQRELAERGGELRTITAGPEGTRIGIDALKPANPRTIVEWIGERWAGSELVAFRERERPATTKTDFVGTIEEQLTERQQTALHLAFSSGYYDANRSVTGAELAGLMGISRATFHQHLRSAERKVLGEFINA